MGIEMDKPPRDMSLTELSDRCSGEVSRYMHEESHNDDYCLEIFRRAMLQKDVHAWELLMQRFHGLLVGWVRRHPSREIAYRLDSEENYVAFAFERFWRVTVRNNALEFNTLASALAFLRACLNSAIIDTLRGYSRPNEVPLPEPGFSEEPAVDDSANGESPEIWQVIKSFLPNERERRVAYLLYHCGLKPREIVQFCPQEFDDVREIYRLIRNIRDRLERNKDRLRWLLGDDE
jgi:DNA-directed RNA polymerase specialized sigma24 family protein